MTQLLTKAYYSSLRLKTIISYNYYYNTQSHELIILNVHSDSEQAQLFLQEVQEQEAAKDQGKKCSLVDRTVLQRI